MSNYALALALVAGLGEVVIVILTALGIEAKGAVIRIARIPCALRNFQGH